MSGVAIDISREVVIPQATNAVARDGEQADAAHPWLSVAGIVRGHEVALRNAIVGGVAGEKVELERGMVRTAFASDEVKIHQGAAQLVLAGGDTSVVQGGAQAILSNGAVRFEMAGAGIVLARQIDLANRSTVVFGLTRHLEVKDGGRVIFGPRAAIVLAGALASVIAAMATLRLRARRA